ncbi:uncharacterized protein MELLADRAFT_78249 [Melampsora larici-populina 98AG31]|uniref:Ribosomal RNA-processing protein 8 n=1 Tax=Melampsora larici-populina (strain 98AG31 / pathotype 3-4-7) TaxID=747676 RepID=F4RS01_MELLP|nr:uncharacterized protein MELLADRAFT_78249 [Melampsora larici-populina 98AG31]EGG04864.1 hypothetical protein MELLADRAFT_78249 [Melampsora larici-populina 98AG31]
MPTKSNNTKKVNEFLFDTPGWSVTSSSNLTSSNKPKPSKKNKSSTKELIPSNQSTSNQDIEKPTKKRKSNPTRLTKKETEPEKKQPIQENTLSSSSNALVQNLMSSTLSGSRFRILNETLYTTTGPEAAQLFSNENENEIGSTSQQTNPNFLAYHEGFRHQTQNWPENPVNIIAHQLKKEYETFSQGLVIVADLGCGEAPLAKLLCGERSIQKTDEEEEEEEEEEEDQKRNKRLKVDQKVRFRVMSYDLVTDRDGWVIAAECSTKVPLPGCQSDTVDNAMVDVVVCCLSLMGTNWVGMILEARRILKQGGQLKIAEVTSRFVDINKFIDFIKLIGFSTPTQDQSNTHFILFEFKKSIRKNPIQLNMNHIYDQPNELDHLIKRGEKLLKPCIYKRR